MYDKRAGAATGSFAVPSFLDDVHAVIRGGVMLKRKYKLVMRYMLRCIQLGFNF